MVGLAAAVAGEDYAVGHATQSRAVDEIVDFVHPLESCEFMAATGGHLGHERQLIGASIRVQCSE